MMKETLSKFWANKKLRWSTLSVLGVILLAVILRPIVLPAKKAELGTVVRGNAIAAVYGTITVEPVTEVLVKSRTSGVIKEINVEQTQIVKAGDVMAKIIDEELETTLEETKVDLESAEQRLKIGPSSANELKSRVLELERITPLVKEGIIAPMELQRVQSVVEDLKRKVAQEVNEMEQEVKVARTKFENAKNQIEQGVIRAPIDGQVLEVIARLGEVVLNQSQLFLVGSKETHLVAVVNEEDVGGLKEGMMASVRLYSYGSRDFQAKVTKIRSQGQNQSFEVILHLTDEVHDVLPGMTGEANIVIGQRENTLMVPTRAIRDGNLLYVIRGGKVHLERVTTGYRNIEFCEVLDGVREGERVILSDHDLFEKGERVTGR